MKEKEKKNISGPRIYVSGSCALLLEIYLFSILFQAFIVVVISNKIVARQCYILL